MKLGKVLPQSGQADTEATRGWANANRKLAVQAKADRYLLALRTHKEHLPSKGVLLLHHWYLEHTCYHSLVKNASDSTALAWEGCVDLKGNCQSCVSQKPRFAAQIRFDCSCEGLFHWSQEVYHTFCTCFEAGSLFLHRAQSWHSADTK